MDFGYAGGEPAFSVEKTRKVTGSEDIQETLLFFSQNCIEMWLIFSVTLSSAALSYTHKNIYILNIYIYIYIYILFLILFHVVYDWILNIVPYSLQ